VKGEGFSLQITTKESVDAIADRVRAAGGDVGPGPIDAPWARVLRVQDPDGFRLAISQPR
jgi:predicted enzyme related to lactoylglutathione lyase